MKKRYFSIIALAFVFGIATLFTSCKSEEEAAADAEATAAEIENLFNDALNEVEAAVDTAVVDAVDSVKAKVEEVVEEVK